MTFQGTINHPYVYGEVHASDGSAAKQNCLIVLMGYILTRTANYS